MNKICRICLEEGVLSSIFTKNFNVSLCDMIEYCCNTKVTKDDGLPESMCSNCVYKLGIAFHFKQTCESADVRLRQYLGLRLCSKFNDASVMTDPIAPVCTTIIKKCKCKLSQSKRSSTNYKRKPEMEKLKRGPKPKPKQIHSCFECNKQFRCQAQLEMHARTHTGDKPFVCMFCPRQFTQKHNLTIHVRVHTGEKPFQCEVCSKRFSAQGNLQAHIKIHTGQKDHGTDPHFKVLKQAQKRPKKISTACEGVEEAAAPEQKATPPKPSPSTSATDLFSSDSEAPVNISLSLKITTITVEQSV